jgi:hypothetical protein
VKFQSFGILNREFEPKPGGKKDYKIIVVANHYALRSFYFYFFKRKAFPPLVELIRRKKEKRAARAPRPHGKFSPFLELSINTVANVAPGLGQPVQPLAPPGRVLAQFHPFRTVLSLNFF